MEHDPDPSDFTGNRITNDHALILSHINQYDRSETRLHRKPDIKRLTINRKLSQVPSKMRSYQIGNDIVNVKMLYVLKSKLLEVGGIKCFSCKFQFIFAFCGH